MGEERGTGLQLSFAVPILDLHLLATCRTLIDGIAMSICPHPCHRYSFMVVITNWYLEFSHIVSSG
jgi:hypothetical protein